MAVAAHHYWPPLPGNGYPVPLVVLLRHWSVPGDPSPKQPASMSNREWSSSVSGQGHSGHLPPLPQAANCQWATVSGPVCWWDSGPQAESGVRGRSRLSPLGPPAHRALGQQGNWCFREQAGTAHSSSRRPTGLGPGLEGVGNLSSIPVT